MKIQIPQLNNREFLRSLFIGYLFSIELMTVIAFIGSFYRNSSIKFFGTDYSGPTMFLLGIFIAPIEATAATISTFTAVTIGLWLARNVFRQ